MIRVAGSPILAQQKIPIGPVMKRKLSGTQVEMVTLPNGRMKVVVTLEETRDLMKFLMSLLSLMDAVDVAKKGIS